MRIVGVKFGGVGRIYHYFTKVPLRKGWTYKIIADEKQDYNTPVVVIDDNVCASEAYPTLRTITKATCVSSPKPNKTLRDKVKAVNINKKKRLTTIAWDNGEVTTVKCHEDDNFNPEFGVALCVLKKCFDNRSSYNDWLREVLEKNGFKGEK